MSIKPKSRLGRGLSSLISVSEEENASVAVEPPAPASGSLVSVDLSSHPTVGASDRRDAHHASQRPAIVEPVDQRGRVLDIPLDQIHPNPHQPRRVMNEATLAELAASLKSTGLIQPIVVRKTGDRYELIAGERRWRAARVAGLATVPALVREASAFEQAQMALVENIQRENLNPIDRALAYRTLMGQLGLTQAELAARMGEERSSIANYLRLLDLGEAVQAMVVDGRLSMGHAKILAGVLDKAEQERLAQIVVGQSLSVRNLERQMQQSATSPAPREDASAHLRDLEKSLTQQLGLRVQLKAAAHKGRGKVILHYGSLDQFDDLVAKLGVRVEG